MARQIAASLLSLQSAKARCSLSPSTAPASELQAINISSQRGDQQHLQPTVTSARASSDKLPAKQQRTSSNDNNEPARSSHLHSSHLRRNSSSKTDLNRSVLATEDAQHLKKLLQDYIASFIKVGDKEKELGRTPIKSEVFKKTHVRKKENEIMCGWRKGPNELLMTFISMLLRI